MPPRNILAAAAKALLPFLTDMATDPRKMKPGELCRVLNSTPLGEVLTDKRLRQHRARAGLRIGDGPTIDLFRYAAWLADEVVMTPVVSVAGDADEDLRWKIYQSIPQKDWLRMSGRQAKVINEQAARYGLPFGGSEINLPDLAFALHNFLAAHARILGKSARHIGLDEEDEDDEPGDDELLKHEKYLRERLRRLADERQTIDRAANHAALAEIAGLIRGLGDALQKKFGPDALEMLDSTLNDCERRIVDMLPDALPEE